MPPVPLTKGVTIASVELCAPGEKWQNIDPVPGRRIATFTYRNPVIGKDHFYQLLLKMTGEIITRVVNEQDISIVQLPADKVEECLTTLISRRFIQNQDIEALNKAFGLRLHYVRPAPELFYGEGI